MKDFRGPEAGGALHSPANTCLLYAVRAYCAVISHCDVPVVVPSLRPLLNLPLKPTVMQEANRLLHPLPAPMTAITQHEVH